MQWNSQSRAGFTEGKPWLPVPEAAAQQNVATLDRDPRSILSFYRAMLALRLSSPTLHNGKCSNVAAQGDVLCFRRTLGPENFFVALNFGAAPASIVDIDGTIALTTGLDHKGKRVDGVLQLAANEGVVIRQD